MAYRRIVFRATLNNLLNGLTFVDVMDFGDKGRLANVDLRWIQIRHKGMNFPGTGFSAGWSENMFISSQTASASPMLKVLL
jgi:hypothetical protein